MKSIQITVNLFKNNCLAKGLTAMLLSCFIHSVNAEISAAEAASLKQLSAEWWQAALATPLATNPLIPNSVDQCVLKKLGTTWLLASTFNGGVFVNRTCKIPVGTTLFMPVLSDMNFNSPGFCGQVDASGNPTNRTVADIRKQISPPLDKIVNLSAELNYVTPLQIWRVESNSFKVTIPNGNLFDPICEKSNLTKVPAGTYSPALAGGYWVKINPLPVGQHTLHTHGELLYVRKDFNNEDIMHDVTYDIEVSAAAP